MKQAAIYISELRGETQTGDLQIKSTLSYGYYVSPYRLPIGSLLHVNEWTGSDRSDVTWVIEDVVTVLIPTVGDIQVDTVYQSTIVQLGQLLMLKTTSGDKVSIYSSEPTDGKFSFLQLVFTGSDHIAPFLYRDALPLTDPAQRNTMIPISCEHETDFQLYFGVFEGKRSYLMNLPNQVSTAQFVFVISGTIEIEERILNEGDSLLLRGYEEIEMECLSGGSIVLVIHLR